MKHESSRESLVNLLLPLSLILGLVLLLSLKSEPNYQTAEAASPFEEGLKVIIRYLATGAKFAAAVAIGGVIVRGSVSYVRQLFSRRMSFTSIEVARLQLGRVLTLGLELTVASDILHTAASPTRQDILNLSAIVLLRTLLNYFLEREIRQGEQSQSLAKTVVLEER
jgi:uncharacterized membrane protein